MKITRNTWLESKQELMDNPSAMRYLRVHLYCKFFKETAILPISKIPDIALPKGFTSIETDRFVKGVCDKCKN